MVNGGDRLATPWTNMHNNACNMILVIHGAAGVQQHVPSQCVCIILTSNCSYVCKLMPAVYYNVKQTDKM